MLVRLTASLDQVVSCVCQGVLSPASLSSAMAAATQQAGILLPAVQQELVQIFKKKKLRDNQN